MPKIVLQLDAEDFNRLLVRTSKWEGSGWQERQEQKDVFQTIGADDRAAIGWHWRYAFWVGPQWATVIFARSYLDSAGHAYQILFHLPDEGDPSYVILTDYPGPISAPSTTEQDGPAPGMSTAPGRPENRRSTPGSPPAWRQNTAVPPPGWDRLTGSDGTQPEAWFTTASGGMRTVVSGYPTWADSPYDKPDDGPGCHHHRDCYDDGDDDLDFEEEQEAVLAGIFDVASRAYVFPDVAPEGGPVTHSFTNLDFCGGWRPPVDSPAAETEALLARTVAGAKPASEVFFFGEGAVAERERWISAAREVGLGALPYRLRMARSIAERLWLAPARLGDRVDRAALSEAWEALLDADHDRGRARSIAAAVATGLETAFTLDLLPPLDPKRPYEGWPHPWWDENSPQGLVVLGAVLGYPPASTYSCLAERLGDVPLALPPSDGHEDRS